MSSNRLRCACQIDVYKRQGFVQALADKCAQLGVGRIATVMGRYYAMDRDKRWERVQE